MKGMVAARAALVLVVLGVLLAGSASLAPATSDPSTRVPRWVPAVAR